MHDVWFGSGLTRDDYGALLASLAIRERRPPPVIALTASKEDAGALVMASAPLMALFHVSSPSALAARLLGGKDPGARRLAALRTGLPLDGAARLERLRFFVGPGSEIVTVLCRRVSGRDGKPLFVAAALGLPAAVLDGESAVFDSPAEPVAAAVPAPARVSEPAVAPETFAGQSPAFAETGMTVQAIQAALRERWPTNRTMRFLWQTDADGVCLGVTPPLAEVVGLANADLVGRNLRELAPQIDETGRLAAALDRKETWSGLEVDWPIADAPAAVHVALGAIPSFDRDPARGGAFDGFRGYGVIRLDQITTRTPTRFASAGGNAAAAAPAASGPTNVVSFPNAKLLSEEDQAAFDTLGADLRTEAGFARIMPEPVPEVVAPAPPEPPVELTAPTAPSEATTPPAGNRAAEIARNGLDVLDRLPVGLLVTRDNIPIFANRHLLDRLGFADEDALHAAGGMAHLFGDQPGNNSGAEAVGIRARDGAIVPTNVRMQRIAWDGLPATLLTLQAVAEPKEAAVAPAQVQAETASGDHRASDEPDHRIETLRQMADDIAAREDELERRHEAMSLAQADALAGHEEYRTRIDGELRRLRAILETATDGVAVIDADGNVVSLNRSGEALFGCDRGSVIGKPFVALFAPNNQSLAADYIDGLKSDATKSLLNDGREMLIKASQGGTIPVLMTLGRLPVSSLPTAQDHKEPLFCALFRDLTHWKQVERELEDAKQNAERASGLKSDFLAKVSHEIRTPLNAILGFAEVIMEERFGPLGNERYRDYLRDVHASGTHVMSLVNDLLDLSKIEAGKMELAVESVDVNKIVAECVALMQPQASRERVIMRLSLAPALPPVQADERSLRQIVLNILSNAVRYNEPGGQVIVATAGADGGRVAIRIRDTGPGMSDADIAAALEPFRQLSPTRAGGTGLGLPLTKALVEANHATFTIRSKVDQGTLVEVAFPTARVLAG